MAGNPAKRQKFPQPTEPADEGDRVPKSFVFKYGKVTKYLGQLTKELRRIMEPNTASKLREHKFNKLKDFAAVAGQFHVTHFIYTMQNAYGVSQLRFFRFPHGPTLTFRIPAYSLCEDVQKITGSTHSPASALTQAPIVVFSNFDDRHGKHVSLTKTFLQNAFPSIDPETTTLNSCKRVVLFHYDSEKELVLLRHYLVVIKVAGVTKGLEELLWKGKIPDLHGLTDISDYLIGNFNKEEQTPLEEGTESSPEQNRSEVDSLEAKPENDSNPHDGLLEQRSCATQKQVQLIEIGPRISLELIRIQQESDSSKQGMILYERIGHPQSNQ